MESTLQKSQFLPWEPIFVVWRWAVILDNPPRGDSAQPWNTVKIRFFYLPRRMNIEHLNNKTKSNSPFHTHTRKLHPKFNCCKQTTNRSTIFCQKKKLPKWWGGILNSGTLREEGATLWVIVAPFLYYSLLTCLWKPRLRRRQTNFVEYSPKKLLHYRKEN